MTSTATDNTTTAGVEEPDVTGTAAVTGTAGADASPRAKSWLRVRTLGRAQLVPLGLIVLVGLAAVLVAVLASRAVSEARVRSSQDAALAAARTGTEQVLSYSPRSVQADLAASRKLVSGDFAAKFDQLATQVILPATQSQGLSTKAKVVRAAVVDATADQAHFVLFVDQSTTAKDQTGAQTSSNQVGVTMTLTGGRWLISDLQPL